MAKGNKDKSAVKIASNHRICSIILKKTSYDILKFLNFDWLMVYELMGEGRSPYGKNVLDSGSSCLDSSPGPDKTLHSYSAPPPRGIMVTTSSKCI